MYSLLLVDDEPNILNGLYQNIDWDELGIDCVYKSLSATGAIEILKNSHVDIIITDIRMPEMEGTQMARFILKNWPFSKIIFLTGYQDFDYARTAVDLGVFRYMLKPVLYDEVQQVVQEAIDVLSKNLATLSEMKNWNSKIKRLKPVIRERLISAWLEQGEMQFLEPSANPAEFELPVLPTDWGFVLGIKWDNSAKALHETAVQHLSVMEMAQEIFNTSCRLIDHQDFAGYSFLLFLDNAQEALAGEKKKMLERMHVFQLAVSAGQSHGCTLFWTDTVPVHGLCYQYQQLRMRMDRHVAIVKDGMIGPVAIQPQQAGAGLSSLRLQPEFIRLIGTRNRPAVAARIRTVFQELSSMQEPDKITLAQVYHEILGAITSDALRQDMPPQFWAGDNLPFLEGIHTFHNLQAFQEVCCSVAESYLDYMQSNTQRQAGSLISEVKQFVQAHLSQELNVAQIAAHFSYHPNYLSRLFKQETGISLQEYMIMERIEKAKSFLEQGVKVTNVSEAVGYDSVAHFSRIFKKVVGYSPKQYQMNKE